MCIGVNSTRMKIVCTHTSSPKNFLNYPRAQRETHSACVTSSHRQPLVPRHGHAHDYRAWNPPALSGRYIMPSGGGDNGGGPVTGPLAAQRQLTASLAALLRKAGVTFTSRYASTRFLQQPSVHAQAPSAAHGAGKARLPSRLRGHPWTPACSEAPMQHAPAYWSGGIDSMADEFEGQLRCDLEEAPEMGLAKLALV